MTLDQPSNPTAPNPDQDDHATDQDDFNAALAKSVREWAAKARQVETARRQKLALRETNDAIEDLRRLRRIGMEHAERTGRDGRSPPSSDEPGRCGDPAVKFIRIARAVRQIIVLQQELLGNRPVAGRRAAADPPAATPTQAEVQADAETPREPDDSEPDDSERNDLADRPEPRDLDDLYDYDDRSFGQVVASIRQTLGVPAEPDDEAQAPAPPPVIADDREPRRRPRLNPAAAPIGADPRERGPP